MAEWIGLIRSLIVYWRPGRQGALRRLYAPLVSEGDLVFDVGAHLGDRSAAFAALGARVVALEPQPMIARWLKRMVGRNARITVLTDAVGRAPGTARLSVSRATPTVSTLSDSWRERVREANPGFRTVRWEGAVEVPVVTLDALIETYGTPSFCKIDVEGYEAEVLGGLSHAVPALSLEFVSGDLLGAVACVSRLGELGTYEFNAIRGEGRDYLFGSWKTPEAMTAWLEAGAGGASSGDMYARLSTARSVPVAPMDSARSAAHPSVTEDD
jgi:FkbM family methyltransferase